ncbi:MAG: hypothetical protein ACP5SH_24095 [Syntrophobacteraceae bacterium]
MCTNPLSDYFAMGGTGPRFQSNCTALWRGYIGTWEILDGRLYLIELHGTLEDGSEAELSSIFPDFPDRVFAHWFSGTIRAPLGKLIQYVHMGYASIHERDLLIEVARGVVTGVGIRGNGIAAAGASDGYGVAAMTFLSPGSKEKG